MGKQVVYNDDLDGTTTDDITTVFFMAPSGTYYEIDLHAANRAKFDKALHPFLSRARETTHLRARAQAKTDDSVATDVSAEMREWARQNGFPDVKDRGRMPADAVEAYNKAHADDAKS